jgi:AraC-like DNA-binding protein
MIQLMNPKLPGIKDVATHLNLGLRSFQRKLKREGVSFKTLKDNIRMDFAMKYLQREDLNLSEITYLLNYSDTSAFNR